MHSLPMGVISLHKFSLAIFTFLENEISSGARPALPMGVAPEAILESFLGTGSSILFPFAISRSYSFCSITSSGARPALPMVVSPEAIVEDIFGYRLKNKCPFAGALHFLLDIYRVLRSASISRVVLTSTAESSANSHNHRVVSDS
jgi:hypothetical protein